MSKKANDYKNPEPKTIIQKLIEQKKEQLFENINIDISFTPFLI